MLSVGLTGGIACGKSTVAEMLVRRGAHLIDLDKLVHLWHEELLEEVILYKFALTQPNWGPHFVIIPNKQS